MAHLEGELVRLRAPEPEDAEELNPWFSDPATLATLMVRFPQSTHGFLGYLEFVRASDDLTAYIIERREDGQAMGACGLEGGDALYNATEMGIWLAEPFRQHGYGTDAVRTLAHHAFLDLGMHRLTLHVYDGNDRAIRAYEKAGFSHEGTMREAMFVDGRWTDVHVMGLLATELRR